MQELRSNALARAGSPPLLALAGGLHAAFWASIVIGVAMIVAALFGLRNAARAEIPLRHYVPFGKLLHRVAVRS